MSRSNPSEDERVVNPAAKFFDWSGSNGNFNYYDKDAKKKIDVDLPFTFLPIAKLVTLKGYNDDTKTSYFANEVTDITKEPFIVKSSVSIGGNRKVRVEAVGLYKDIKKSVVDALGINYTESLYIGIKNGKELSLCNIQIKGAALSPWFDLVKLHNPMKIAVQVKSSIDKKKGAVKYKEPVFTPILKVSEEMNNQAIELDNKLQEYLKGYFLRVATELESSPADAASKPEAKSEPVTKAAAVKDTKSPFKGNPKEAHTITETEEDNGDDIVINDSPDEF